MNSEEAKQDERSSQTIKKHSLKNEYEREIFEKVMENNEEKLKCRICDSAPMLHKNRRDHIITSSHYYAVLDKFGVDSL